MGLHCELAPSVPLTISDGKSSISPSVYVAYRSLGAPYNCPAFGPQYFPSGPTYDTTIAYPPEALSTSMCDGPPAGFQLYTAVNYTQLQFPTGAETTGTCEWRIGQQGSSARGPVLSIPSNVLSVDPSWSTCTGAFEGSFDPPSALHKAANVVAPGPTPPPSASPGGSVIPGNAPATQTVSNENPKQKASQLVPGNSQPPQQPPANPQPSSLDPVDPGAPKLTLVKSVSVSVDPDQSAAASPGSQNAPSQKSPPGQSGGQGSSDPSHNSGSSNPVPVASNGAEDSGSGTGNSPPPNSVVAAGNTIVRDPGGGVIVASSTYAPGQTAQISGDTPLSVGPDHVVVGGTSYALPPASPTNPAPLAAHSIVRASNGGIVIGSSTIAPGQQASIAGHVISAGSSVALVDGSTYALAPSAGAIVQAPPAPSSPSPVLIAGQSAIKATNGGLVIGSSIIAPGSQANVAGHAVSVGSSNAVVDGTTYALPSSNGGVLQALPTPPPVLDAGQTLVRASNGGIVIGSSTIGPGQQATVAGHIISVGSSVAAVDGTTYALPSSPGATLQQAPNLAQNIAVNSKVTLANGAVISAGGSPATVDGTVVAIPSDNSGLIVNGKTVPLPTVAPNSIFAVAGQTFTAAPTGFAVDGQFVSSGGPAITLSGTVVSLGPAGLQVGTSTVPLTPAERSSGADANLGGLIMGGLGDGINSTGGASNSSGPVTFTGAGSRVQANFGTLSAMIVATFIFGLVSF